MDVKVGANTIIVPDDAAAVITAGAVDAFKAALPKVPDAYEVSLPKDSFLQAETLKRTTALARELGLTKSELAQKVLEYAHSEAQSVAEKLRTDYGPGGSVFEGQRKKWTDEALAAPDLGEGKPEVLQAKVALVTAFTNKYFPEDVRKLINDTGIGNHPGFFRAVYKLAEGLKEDGFIAGASGGAPKKSASARIFDHPDSQKQLAIK